jgi:hypothetical protein
MQLIENPPVRLRFDAPIYFLLFHAAELYLKSYLRQKGEDLEALKGLSHYHVRMCKNAAAHGLKLPPLTLDIFEFLDKTDAVIESRYIRRGSKQPVGIPALLGVVRGIRATVKKHHEVAGVMLAAVN